MKYINRLAKVKCGFVFCFDLTGQNMLLCPPNRMIIFWERFILKNKIDVTREKEMFNKET